MIKPFNLLLLLLLLACCLWNAIRAKYPIQGWHEVVWGGNRVPRWSFILWSAVLQRLNSRDRLRSWSMLVDDCCYLWGKGIETHQLLFFECSEWLIQRVPCNMNKLSGMVFVKKALGASVSYVP